MRGTRKVPGQSAQRERGQGGSPAVAVLGRTLGSSGLNPLAVGFTVGRALNEPALSKVSDPARDKLGGTADG